MLVNAIRQDTLTRPTGVLQPPQGIKPVCEVSRLSYTLRCDITTSCSDNKERLAGALWEILPIELRLWEMSFLGC